MKSNCIYFVEGQCEEKFLDALKQNPSKIHSGRVKVLNVITSLISRSQLISIPAGATIVFVFDTDVPVTEQLKKNIEHVKKFCTNVKVLFVPQVLNLEDELMRCTDVKNVTELTHSQTIRDFKRDFCALTNCRDTLNRHQLDMLKLWSQNPPAIFHFISQDSKKIKN